MSDEKEVVGRTMGDAWTTLFNNVGCLALLIVIGLMGGCFDSAIRAWRHS